MIKKILCFMIILFVAVPLLGCRAKEKIEVPNAEQGIYSVYYENSSSTKLISKNYKAEKTEAMDLVYELMSQLAVVPLYSDYQPAIKEGITLLNAKIDSSILYLYFNSEYSRMEPVNEILCRAAIVKTLNPIKGVESVKFYVADQPFIDAGGSPVDVMKDSDFTENAGDVISSYNRATLTLYFANESGNKLIENDLSVVYTNNISMERLIVEELIKGPRKEGLYPTLSNKVNLLGVSVSDNICYVKFDSTFLTELEDVSDYIPIYSIVNSLYELPNVNKVQISINGSKDVVFRDSIPLDKALERNLDYVGE